MRSIGEFDHEDHATNFCGYLNGINIRTEVEDEGDEGPWTVWVHDEEKLDEARSEIALFRISPDDPKYLRIAQEGEARAQEEAKKLDKLRRKEMKFSRNWNRGSGVGRVTLGIICACVFFYILSNLSDAIRGLLMMSIYKKEYAFLPEILKQGQIWRLVTPIFLHLSFFHILFNMYWTFELGRMVESRKSSIFLICFVLVAAVISNFLQYIIAGAGFGGMSGVVYGLFGYVWMKGKYDPGEGMFLHPSTIMIMLFWFAFCFVGPMNIANGAHAGGLAVGTLWGYLSSTVVRR